MTALTVALGDVVHVRGGGTPSKSKPEYYTGDIPWVTPKDMKVWEIDDAIDKITVEAVTFSATNLIPENAILLVNRSGILKHTLPVGITRRPVAINQDIKALVCSERAHPEYIAHLVKAAEPTVLKWVRATTADNFSIQNLKELMIPLPPLEEQKRIAGILDQADALRRLRARALDKLNTLGQAIFHEMFGDFDRYSRKSLNEVIEARSSLADPTSDENAHLPHVGPEHIRQGAGTINWQRVRSCAEDGVTSGKYRFEAGDVIYSKIRPYLNKVAIADRVGMCSADMYALTPKLDSITVPYLHFILGSESFLSYAATVSGRANIPKMNRKQLMAFMLPMPPRDEQARFEARLNALWAHRARGSDHQMRAETLFTSLQHRAFRGEL